MVAAPSILMIVAQTSCCIFAGAHGRAGRLTNRLSGIVLIPDDGTREQGYRQQME